MDNNNPNGWNNSRSGQNGPSSGQPQGAPYNNGQNGPSSGQPQGAPYNNGQNGPYSGQPQGAPYHNGQNGPYNGQPQGAPYHNGQNGPYSGQPYTSYQSAPYSEGYDPQDIEKNRVWTALAYFGILFFLPLVISPNSRYGRFHANQGLVLLLFEMAGNCIFHFIPLIGGMLQGIYGVLMFILFVIGIINALQGHATELPVIGSIHIIK